MGWRLSRIVLGWATALDGDERGADTARAAYAADPTSGPGSGLGAGLQLAHRVEDAHLGAPLHEAG